MDPINSIKNSVDWKKLGLKSNVIGDSVRQIEQQLLRKTWLQLEAERKEAFKAFCDAHKDCPHYKRFKAAEAAENTAKEAYAKSLRGEINKDGE